MIDLGISYKQLKERLEKIGFSPSSIKKVFISHEHTDHIKGLQTFLKNHSDVKLYVHSESFKEMKNKNSFFAENEQRSKFILVDIDKNSNSITKINKEATKIRANVLETFSYEEISIKFEEFSIKLIEGSHDSKNCYVYYMDTPSFKLFHATDIGKILPQHEKYLAYSNFVLIESNYCARLLKTNQEYPEYLKDRIKKDTGHLENGEATNAVAKLDPKVVKHVCFAHLSENNNHPDKVKQSNREIMLNMHILPANDVHEIYFIKEQND